MSDIALAAALLGAALILAVGLHAYARLRVEQERTLQKLIDRGLTGDALLPPGWTDRAGRDTRRGLLLLGLGFAWSTVTYFVGGKAWIFGVFPVVIGAVYLVLRFVDGRRS